MWLEVFDFLSIVIAVICCSAAVKLADDYLDREYDVIAGKANWTEVLEQGTMLYAMFLLALAAGINTSLSLSLFLSCYIVGMFSSMRDKFPSRLSGFQESLIALTIGIFLFGLHTMLFSLSFILAIQLFDDYIDEQSDHLVGQRNFANRFGEIECLIASLIFIITAWGVNEKEFIPVLTGTAIVYLVSFYYERIGRL